MILSIMGLQDFKTAPWPDGRVDTRRSGIVNRKARAGNLWLRLWPLLADFDIVLGFGLVLQPSSAWAGNQVVS